MPMTPGLSSNIRMPQEEPQEAFSPDEEVMVEIEEGAPKHQTDDKGNILRIEHEDGSVSVSLDGRPVEDATDAERAADWFSNLVDDIDQSALHMIADDLLRGVQDDLDSRQDWIEDRAQGIKLLGLKIELPQLQGAADGAPVDGMSRVRHPLLLEAVLRFQANARSEMLPTDGPVKVRVDSVGTTMQQDFLAEALEKDLNAYLTAVAKEYYPDTDRMLFMLGFGGTAFKKVYFCPLRGRPVSETVDADDLIVNNAATTLSDAKRVTHRVFMRSSTVKRLQILGVYRDIDLSTPRMEQLDAVQREKADQQGVSVDTRNPDDRDREIYEVYCELDVPGFEHKYKGKITGLEIPYRVTIDVSSREVLSIVTTMSRQEKKGTNCLKPGAILSSILLFPVWVFTILVYLTFWAIPRMRLLPLGVRCWMPACMPIFQASSWRIRVPVKTRTCSACRQEVARWSKRAACQSTKPSCRCPTKNQDKRSSI